MGFLVFMVWTDDVGLLLVSLCSVFWWMKHLLSFDCQISFLHMVVGEGGDICFLSSYYLFSELNTLKAWWSFSCCQQKATITSNLTYKLGPQNVCTTFLACHNKILCAHVFALLLMDDSRTMLWTYCTVIK